MRKKERRKKERRGGSWEDELEGEYKRVMKLKIVREMKDER